MTKKYSKPPILEAVCDFQFIPSQPWDMTIPGLFFEKIRLDFPEKKQQTNLRIGLSFGKEMPPIFRSGPRMQFLRQDKSALIQLGPDRLSINYLKPYPKWEKFKSLIFQVLKYYEEIAKPKGFKRIGLKYINRISFYQKDIDLPEYFYFLPLIPEAMPKQYHGINIQVEFSYGDHDRLKLMMASLVPEGEEKLAVLLDLDYIMQIPEAISFSESFAWLEDAHTRVENAFEACISDKSRALFGEEK